MRNTESDPYLFLEGSVLFSLTAQNFLLVSYRAPRAPSLGEVSCDLARIAFEESGPF